MPSQSLAGLVLREERERDAIHITVSRSIAFPTPFASLQNARKCCRTLPCQFPSPASQAVAAIEGGSPAKN